MANGIVTFKLPSGEEVIGNLESYDDLVYVVGWPVRVTATGLVKYTLSGDDSTVTFQRNSVTSFSDTSWNWREKYSELG